MLTALLLTLQLVVGAAFGAVDINTATAAELESLPGIGPSKAAAIVQYRTDHGPFKTIDELDNVSGIGPSTMEALRSEVTIGKGAAAPTGSAAAAPAAAPAAASPSAAPAGACAVNINSADASALQTLPGIGESKAAAILQDRKDNGPFATCDDLDRVSGIGPSTVANLKACCVTK